MSSKVYEKDGETFIVSDDVDINTMNLDDLVSFNDDQKKISSVVQNLSSGIISSNKPKPTEEIASEKIWLELSFLTKTEEVPYSGFVESVFNSKSCIKYKIWLDRAQAINFVSVYNEISLCNKNLYCNKISYFYEDKKIDVEMKKSPILLKKLKLLDKNKEKEFICVKLHLVSDQFDSYLKTEEEK